VRALMEEAAAKEWGVAVSEVSARNGEVVHTASGRTRGFGALVATARTIAMPAATRIRIKTPAERRWEGKQMTSIDLVPMTTGKGVYGADVIPPGMKVAVIARSAGAGAGRARGR
jgi:isoquinoline 1-oxidoreductase beta subunit